MLKINDFTLIENRSQSSSRQNESNKQSLQSNKKTENRNEVVPRSMMHPIPMRKENGMLIPEGTFIRFLAQNM